MGFGGHLDSVPPPWDGEEVTADIRIFPQSPGKGGAPTGHQRSWHAQQRRASGPVTMEEESLNVEESIHHLKKVVFIIYLFIKIFFSFRDRGREGEREGEKHQREVADEKDVVEEEDTRQPTHPNRMKFR